MTAPTDTRISRYGAGRAPLDRARSTSRAAADRAVAVLDRLIPLARRLGRVVRLFGILVALAAATIAVVLLWGLRPSDPAGWIGFIAVGAVLAAPPVVLLVFASVLRDVLELPAKLRETPEIGRLEAGELTTLAREAASRRVPHESPRAFPLDLWRAGKLMISARGELIGWGVVMRLASLPFLVAVWFAFMLGLFELVAAPSLVIAVAVLETV